MCGGTADERKVGGVALRFRVVWGTVQGWICGDADRGRKDGGADGKKKYGGADGKGVGVVGEGIGMVGRGEGGERERAGGCRR